MSRKHISPGGFAAILSLTLEATPISIGMSPVIQLAHEDAWMVPPLAIAAVLLVMYPLYRLFARLGEQLFADEQPMSIWALLLLVPFCCVLMYWMVFNTRVFSDVIRMCYLPDTPSWVIYGGFLAVCAFASFHGVEVLARTAMLITGVKLVFLGVTPIFIFDSVDLNNFLPILPHGVLPVLRALLDPFAWFAEGAVLAFLFPLVKKGRYRHVLLGFGLMLETYYVQFLCSILVFTAPLTARMVYPALLLVQMMAIGDFFDRLDPILVAVWAFSMFVKVAIYLLVLSALLSRMLRVKLRTRISWVLALSGVFLADSVVHNIGQEMELYKQYWPMFSLFVLLDLYLLVWVLLRKQGSLHAPPALGEDSSESWKGSEGRTTDGST